MASCRVDHGGVWDLECPTCKQPVDYGELAGGLLDTPRFELGFENIEVLFVGNPHVQIPGAFTCSLATGPRGKRTLDALTIREVDGGTWGDYLGQAETLRSWLEWASLGRSRHTIAVIDATSPISVLAARDRIIRSSVVLAVAAGRDSTPMEKSTTFAALSAVNTAKSPTLLLTRSYAEALTLYEPETGVLRGGSAVGRFAGRLAQSVDAYAPLLERDRRLDVHAHTISLPPTASDRVYRDPAQAVEAAALLRSAPHGDGEVLTLHLLAEAPARALKRIEKAYQGLRDRFPNLLDSGSTLVESRDARGLYEITILYGLRGDPLLPIVEDGYEAVAERAPRLRLEATS